MLCSHCSTPRSIKMACVELYGGVQTEHRQKPTQIPIGFCTSFICIRVRLDLGVGQCECTIR